MQSPALTFERPATALDLRLSLRAVTVAVGATAGLWRLVNVVGIPLDSAAPTLAFGVLLGLAQLAWTARMVLRPSRRWLLLGAGGTAVSLLASFVILATEPVGRGGVVPAVVGVGLQLTFLLLTLAGAARTVPAVVLRNTIRVGLATVALTMSVLVAGGAQDHAHAGVGEGRDAKPAAPTAAPRSLLCHLI